MSDPSKRPSDAPTGLAATPGPAKRPRPSLKPPNSAGAAEKRKRMSVKFADTADIRLIFQFVSFFFFSSINFLSFHLSLFSLSVALCVHLLTVVQWKQKKA